MNAAGRIPAVLAGLPATALAVASLWATCGAAAGRGLWPPDEVNLSEAVVTRNAAEAGRLLALGGDPNRPAAVRPGLLRESESVTLTPLEAAVWMRDPSLVRLLRQSGAIPTAEALRVLRCLTDERPDAGVRAHMETLSAEPWPECAGVTLPLRSR